MYFYEYIYIYRKAIGKKYRCKTRPIKQQKKSNFLTQRSYTIFILSISSRGAITVLRKPVLVLEIWKKASIKTIIYFYRYVYGYY